LVKARSSELSLEDAEVAEEAELEEDKMTDELVFALPQEVKGKTKPESKKRRICCFFMKDSFVF
jgi:hypothetical protein